MKDKLNKTTDSVKKTANDIKTAWKNFVRLLEASALVVVAVYTIKQALEMEQHFLFYVLVVAGSLIAVRGAIEFFRHLANKE